MRRGICDSIPRLDDAASARYTVVAYSAPSFGPWIFAGLCYAVAAVQLLGFIGVSRVRMMIWARTRLMSLTGERRIIQDILDASLPLEPWRILGCGCVHRYFCVAAPASTDSMRGSIFC